MAFILFDLDTDEGKVTLEISAKVLEMRDPLGTGDSPREYDIEIFSIDGSDGKTYREEDLPRDVLSEINERLIGSR